jgi:carboxyl-terminal processing protease
MHPDTDTIRMARSRPSVLAAGSPAPGVLRLRIIRFGRLAEREVLSALAAHPCTAVLELDLRGHPGGRLRNMLRLAGIFTGPVPDAVILKGTRHTRLSIPPRPSGAPEKLRLRVLVDGATASSAEVFAALLRRHAAARVLGTRTRGKDWVLGAVAVTHDWRLLIPVARIVVPGEKISGGLRPDAPLTEE